MGVLVEVSTLLRSPTILFLLYFFVSLCVLCAFVVQMALAYWSILPGPQQKPHLQLYSEESILILRIASRHGRVHINSRL